MTNFGGRTPATFFDTLLNNARPVKETASAGFHVSSAAGGVEVPFFIKNGDRIRIKTEDREYQGKEH